MPAAAAPSQTRTAFPAALWAVVAFLALATLPFACSDLDLTLARWCYTPGWAAGETGLWDWLYRFGTLPGLLLSAASLGILVLGASLPRWRAWRRPAAIVLITLALGPGLLVNALGKAYWGRPRPREVTAFGGTETFLRVTHPGVPGRGKSFPSGHPSVGYLFGALYFAGGSRRRRWTWLGTGVGYGTLMGIGRMVQGAHFASDVLWSGGLTLLSAAVADAVFLPAPDAPVWTGAASPAPPSRVRAGRLLLLAGGLAVLTAFFLLASPYYKTWRAEYPGDPGLTTVRLRSTGPESIRILRPPQKQAVIVEAGLRGFGFPKLKLDGRLDTVLTGTTCTATVDLKLRGWVTERRGEIRFSVRPGLAVQVETPAAAATRP